MAAKAPIYLKRRSRKGKKEKLRDLLSSDMISPPLGDFRHTIHIGGGGADDLFGDLSFLQGKFHLLPGQRDHQGACELSRAASVSGTPPVSDGSPLLKNALSLPVIGGVQALTLPAAGGAPSPQQPPPLAPPPKPPRLHLESPPTSLPASPSRSPPLPLGPGPDARHMAGQGEEEEEEERPYLSHAGSLLSLHLDLGPSILDDVLQIMDGQRTGAFNGGFTPSGRQEVYI
ncbi:cdc42 effector protein 2 [Electrophorus electricus]|uniref:cdc42 effector protein 2 n=1 Tax=Electrophorus electricus TaxID=8005 RepID=UPI0015D06397|nr:cdc42 effector protein 2 [Electrophorus electricus]XP_035383386.1 cdc42 effector protein 2 [Electrophorus electricus]XP_035383387.1 cdc42 effector protein 2 [Electrophorus electricus]XP_035383388.1 cdc42 effector protein 2 [Electrophorus electricus]XP_035383389.1 cdc42 effector protein 2 [Electrophorus electricus]XP_035383390.1 cdc42 effector protein 2 [Electrophorus electricus]XP_035383391.1 cdc42 effector protein 2 [Electrophorus electricus]